MDFDQLKNKIYQIIDNHLKIEETLQEICDLLRLEIDYYDWVGFYFKNKNRDELKLAQFAGKPTEHTIIPFGKGICGQVAISNKNLVVQDVTVQDNYISCGIKVKSEIVIPIFKKGENIGQIDIDSHQKSPFTKDDEKFLEFVCEKISKII